MTQGNPAAGGPGATNFQWERSNLVVATQFLQQTNVDSFFCWVPELIQSSIYQQMHSLYTWCVPGAATFTMEPIWQSTTVGNTSNLSMSVGFSKDIPLEYLPLYDTPNNFVSASNGIAESFQSFQQVMDNQVFKIKKMSGKTSMNRWKFTSYCHKYGVTLRDTLHGASTTNAPAAINTQPMTYFKMGRAGKQVVQDNANGNTSDNTAYEMLVIALQASADNNIAMKYRVQSTMSWTFMDVT